MLGVAAVHGWAMLQWLPSHPSFTAPFRSLCRLFLGFAANLAVAAARTFVATAISEPDWRSLAYGWPYGLLIIAAAFLLLFWLVRHALREPTRLNLTRFTLHAFSISAFLALLGLCAARQFHATSLDSAALNLTLATTVPRYVVPLHFIVIASAIEIAVRLTQWAPRFTPAAFCTLALAALVAQRDFKSTTFAYVSPLTRISHAHAWQLLLVTVRECRAAGLPVPEVPLGALTQEFSEAETGSFEPLWRHDLQLRADEKIERMPWEQYLAGDRERYRSVPSLRLLEQKLELRRD
jgi:FtsH-binding integral membrane protein